MYSDLSIWYWTKQNLANRNANKCKNVIGDVVMKNEKSTLGVSKVDFHRQIKKSYFFFLKV